MTIMFPLSFYSSVVFCAFQDLLLVFKKWQIRQGLLGNEFGSSPRLFIPMTICNSTFHTACGEKMESPQHSVLTRHVGSNPPLSWGGIDRQASEDKKKSNITELHLQLFQFLISASEMMPLLL